jgi:hypothetical protein
MAMERRYISMLHRLHNVPACKRDEIPLFILLGQLRALDDGAPIDYQRKDKHLTQRHWDLSEWHGDSVSDA